MSQTLPAARAAVRFGAALAALMLGIVAGATAVVLVLGWV